MSNLKILDLERQLTEAKRQIAAREATIEDQARQLERAHGKAWEIEKLVIELGGTLNGGF
jgi:uncharacterized protein (DUF3084 family)